MTVMRCVGLVFAVMMTLAFGCQSGPDSLDRQATVEPTQLGETDRVHACGNVLLASQPAEADLDVLADRGYRSVLNLRTKSEMEQLGFDQKQQLADQNITYYHIGIAGADGLTDGAIDAVRMVLNDEQNHPIFVHCASANRVGAVWLAHRVLDAGLDYEAALAEARRVGLRSDALEQRARDYILRRLGQG